MRAWKRPLTLAVDIGGTWIKAMLLDPAGRPASGTERVPTPRPARPPAVFAALRTIAALLPGYDRVSLGFPGVVENGVARTAANLHPAWIGVQLPPPLFRVFDAPVRIANDADIQGLGLIEGRGVELVITLGTGIGSALFLDGALVPNLELGHHPFELGRTYEQRLGDRVLKRIGARPWKARLVRALLTLQRTFNPRRIYVGGGNARLLRRGLPRGVVAADNVAGLLGGIRLWAPVGLRPVAGRPARRGGKRRS
jgi:polyphosphate glucokinase